MTVTDITAIVGAIVAVVALGLSIYNFVVNRKDKMPTIEVRLSRGTGHKASWKIPEESPTYPIFKIEIVNIGQVPVPLTALVLEGKLRTDLDESIEGTIVNQHSPPCILERDYEIVLKETGEDNKDGKGWIRAIISIPTGKKFHSNKLRILAESK